METLILIISVLGSASGGMLGVGLWFKHSRKLLISEGRSLDHFFGNSTIASLLIVLLGVAGFCLPSAVLKEVFVSAGQTSIEDIDSGDRSSPPKGLKSDSNPVINAVPIGE